MENLYLNNLDNINGCYNCVHWHLTDPNCGGLIDIGICDERLIETYENTYCVSWSEVNEKQKTAFGMVRKALIDNIRKMRKDYSKVDKKKIKEEVIDDILDKIQDLLS